MTQLSERYRTRILPPSPVDPELVRREQETQQALEERYSHSYLMLLIDNGSTSRYKRLNEKVT